MTGQDPALDPKVRADVELALAAVLRVAGDVVRRRQGPDGGYEMVGGDLLRGDVHGIANAGYLEVVKPLEEACARARAVLDAVMDQVDEDKRDRYGTDHWHPPARLWDAA